ncbi:hypothetical protein [Desertivirga xinjiangensis]|uniref:hypothetical protein n=1 Tax=Desertivirga xinjiangensis TaxID=539206 RepID=UPI00210AB6DF|nr:hypothetical protein [Pedobacter xinjiangensis]
MKKVLGACILCLQVSNLFAQRLIFDEAIKYQQERMVYKQWDKDKFIPDKGFLGLNPLYWLTWGLHPDYPKTDKRPLGPVGPQTQRLALLTAMANTARQYKLESDTLSTTAISEAVNYSPLLSDADPLWLMYYQSELSSLTDFSEDVLNGAGEDVKVYLTRNGGLNWYLEEIDILKERLNLARSSIFDRGSRIISYHRILKDYRRLLAAWEAKKQNARKQLNLFRIHENLKGKEGSLSRADFQKSDIDIANSILSKSKL